MKGLREDLSEEHIVLNSRPNFLYSHDFGRGRFFQIVHNDEDGFGVRLAPKTMLKVIYLKEKDDIEGFEIIKVVAGEETQRVVLSKFNFQQVGAFLEFISAIDLKAISETRLRIADDEGLSPETIRRVKTILSQEGGDQVILELISEGILTSIDLVNTAYRKRQLKIFWRLLNQADSWKRYAEKHALSVHHEEKAWQHFFSNNDWIFGYGLDYRFEEILQREFYASSTQADDSGSVITDFLLGDNNFTTFVEIKTPATPLFGLRQNRSNSWTLSSELVNAVSQILEQKASGLIRIETDTLHDSEGNEITQHAYDSKVLLIVGSWKQLRGDSDNVRRIKEKTFELYRRDSRNIKFLTFDELYTRANFIVEHSAKR